MLLSAIASRIIVCLNVKPDIIDYPVGLGRDPVLGIFYTRALAYELQLFASRLPVFFERDFIELFFIQLEIIDCLDRALLSPFPLPSGRLESKDFIAHCRPVDVAPESHPL